MENITCFGTHQEKGSKAVGMSYFVNQSFLKDYEKYRKKIVIIDPLERVK
ncbi:hypothetical protein [Desulfosporosinus sp.]|nr:hypothetical protein [Desulfosporosinus sp.]